MTYQPEECTLDMKKKLNDLRVKELLGNHIPVDEAKLLSNGRITCLICVHRPVFDTTNVLSVHRRGKRHLAELEKFLKRKEELSLLDVKSKHLETKGNVEKSLLGCKAAKFKHLEMKRKPRLDVIDSNKLPPKKIVPRSATSQLKSYIKKSAQTQSFTELVDEMREGSLCSTTRTIIGELSIKKKLSRKTECPKTEHSHVNEDIERRMSGWLKDASGNWVKDPDAEFDSDEEMP
ncbi:sodium channel modifier 1 [Nilaparvata lugens]|uniref:sodium channel modifier 1 n=1 Tax=Nilaparvata lugens TaxID=108931 RepID=UPI00193EA047|nr:sodium channel modifier 1 [Nilaparvata lugens]